MKLGQILLLTSGLLFNLTVHAWTLDTEQSSVNFVTIKKTNLAETHQFTDFSGEIKKGKASVTIKADSIDSRVPIRNERMREFLFETGAYPLIQVNSDVTEVLSGLTLGDSKTVSTSATLSMHGVTKEITLELRVNSLSESTMSVSSTEPVLVHAAHYEMVEGIQKLSSLVNGLHIAETVPVYFSLVFQK